MPWVPWRRGAVGALLGSGGLLLLTLWVRRTTSAVFLRAQVPALLSDFTLQTTLTVTATSVGNQQILVSRPLKLLAPTISQSCA